MQSTQHAASSTSRTSPVVRYSGSVAEHRRVYEDFTARPDAESLHTRLYAGAIARFIGLSPMQELVAFTRDFLERFLAPHVPIESHRGYGDTALAEIYGAARREFGKSLEVQRLWHAVFEAAGLDPAQTARDRLVLRFQPPDPPDGLRPWARSTATVSFHRDTWGTNLYAQINWWAPVYPLDPGRTFAFFPALFDREIANNSAEFDISDVMRRNREAPETVQRGEMVPRPLESFDARDGVPVLIAPGEVIAFSAQHAHVGVQNRTDLTRISLETRTLRIPDMIAHRGAPNVDGRARWMTPGMFRRISDGAALNEILRIQPLHPFAPAPATMQA